MTASSLAYCPTDEERMLHDAVTGYLGRSGTAPAEWTRDKWRAMAQQLGICGTGIAVDAGGLGQGYRGHRAVMEAIGEAMAVEPYLPAVVMVGELLAHDDDGAHADYVHALVAGDRLILPALFEPGRRTVTPDLSTIAVAEGNHYRLSGAKTLVPYGRFASHFIISARMSYSAESSLFIVDASDAGIVRRDGLTIDDQPVSELRLEDVLIGSDSLIGVAGTAMPTIERAIDGGVAVQCAQAVGLMRRLLRETITYLAQRHQFGHALADFQALQHRVADMAVAREMSVGMAYLAALAMDRSPEDRSSAVSAAKTVVGRAVRDVAEAALQLHGGIGMTEESAIGRLFRQATALTHTLGSPEDHLARFALLNRHVVS